MLGWNFKLQKGIFFFSFLIFYFSFFFSLSLHALMYHLLPSKNHRTFLPSASQQISSQQKQELPALLLKLLACLCRLSDISTLYPDSEVKSISSLSLGKELWIEFSYRKKNTFGAWGKRRSIQNLFSFRYFWCLFFFFLFLKHIPCRLSSLLGKKMYLSPSNIIYEHIGSFA